jgi:hypothetical protein
MSRLDAVQGDNSLLTTDEQSAGLVVPSDDGERTLVRSLEWSSVAVNPEESVRCGEEGGWY